MAKQGSSATLPVVITYRTTERSRTKKIKILRGKTDDNISKLVDMEIPGITEKSAIDHVQIGYSFIPKDKLTAADKKAIEQINQENITYTTNLYS